LPAELERIAIRPAQAGDAPRVRELMLQLGYDVGTSEIVERLGASGPQFALWVAEDAEAGVIGWIAITLTVRFVGGLRTEIEGFVVDESARGRGVGARLLASAEQWAREHGSRMIRLQSNVVRERAHRFYETHGYRKLKAQFAIEKAL